RSPRVAPAAASRRPRRGRPPRPSSSTIGRTPEHVSVRGALTLLVCALAGVLAATAPAASQGAVYTVGDCIHPSQRPASIVVACADGNYALSGLRYTSWGGAVARAA